jgi:hypothetical protein
VHILADAYRASQSEPHQITSLLIADPRQRRQAIAGDFPAPGVWAQQGTEALASDGARLPMSEGQK